MKLINPTLWKGERYTSCTEVDSHGLEWCSTLTDILDNHLTGYWGNCDNEQNELAQVIHIHVIDLQNYRSWFVTVESEAIYWRILLNTICLYWQENITLKKNNNIGIFENVSGILQWFLKSSNWKSRCFTQIYLSYSD